MKLTCAALAGLLWAGAALAAGPAPAPEESAEDAPEEPAVTYPSPPTYETTMPAARHRFPSTILEDMRRKILIKTGQLEEEPEEQEAPKPASGH
ncbi:MAG: hypothetical protein ACU0FH_02510 [Heliomarina sp.]|uniref:hypothetical protein n=1 Tax=Heliomarina sp. TaxID=2917556 RepID=UPI004059CFE0